MNILMRPPAMTSFFGKLALSMLVLLGIFTTSSALAVERDEKKHFAASTAISATLTAATDKPWVSFGGCIAVGAAKELYDDRQSDNHFDWQDMKYNTLGCAIGIPIGKGARWLFTDGRSFGFRANF
ncbi:hypothetical protein ACPF7Z_09920 [Halomonas sp. GXIMD04776]|uniref:hypothetical protein n=1 Tax=Halomonas sp. GXIMD04776 TaxID=3415605 RepID=UPI003CC17A90